MNMNQTTEKLVSIFTQNELSALMTAMGGYINTKNKQKRPTGVETVLFNKIVDALLVCNYMNAVEMVNNKTNRMGAAEYKMSEAQLEAMYESDVRAHS
jgi:hypothetical protein